MSDNHTISDKGERGEGETVNCIRAEPAMRGSEEMKEGKLTKHSHLMISRLFSSFVLMPLEESLLGGRELQGRYRLLKALGGLSGGWMDLLGLRWRA